jgi:hypothetical protein
MYNGCRRSIVVEMSREAIGARLRAVARLLGQRGFVDKGVDMSVAAVTMRLRTMAALSSMCRRLTKATVVNGEMRVPRSQS